MGNAVSICHFDGTFALLSSCCGDHLPMAGHMHMGCTGTATAELTLAGGSPLNFNPNYFPTHDVSDFISFQYTSSSGSFFLDNTSPYLYAQAGAPFVTNGILLEKNGQGPNTLELWQFSFNLAANPGLTLSSGPGAWQFLQGSYFYNCLDPQCTTWTDDVIRDVGVGGNFSEVRDPASVPGPVVGAGLPGILTAVAVFIGWRRRRLFLDGNVWKR
jgi:hypothetical protein